MVKFQIVKHDKPHMKIEKMKCDGGIDAKLNNYELTKFLNNHITTCFLGKPRSGKTTLLNSFFSSKDILKGVYHDIYLFQPSHSRANMSNDIWEKGIKKENAFNELTEENLEHVMQIIKSQEYYVNSCVIFDDCTAYLKKNNKLITLLEDFVFNRRQYHCSIFFLVQSIKSVPAKIRPLFESLFIFRVSKETMTIIFDEFLEEFNKTDFIANICKFVFDEPHNFLFVNVDTQQMFKNWDEILPIGLSP
jgi:hypothetical protein